MNYKNFIAKCMKLREDWSYKEFWFGDHVQRSLDLIDGMGKVRGDFDQLEQARNFLSATLLEYRMRFNCMMQDGSPEEFFAKRAERNKQPQPQETNEKSSNRSTVGCNCAMRRANDFDRNTRRGHAQQTKTARATTRPHA